MRVKEERVFEKLIKKAYYENTMLGVQNILPQGQIVA